MGQQQLLLIVLGVIIVGIAIVVGINLFNANAESSTQDSIVAQGTNIGALAQQYYKKPVALGGGGNSFAPTETGATQFTDYWNGLPTNLKTSTDAIWATPTLYGGDTGLVFIATPQDASYGWTVATTVTPTTIVSKVVQ
ncbi:MAG: hypothetical protein PHY57_06690 [Ignavibacterium sp.]|jgi:hypothetical protein|nr:MAG: hypothetical protein F9K42_04500 [Ignavibacterium sp.]MDD5608183.1 hypothetical protein [Ignavibacterium sp.]MDX9713752.1 hypothetical protein [Ignavibacteriaceae bacterium]